MLSEDISKFVEQVSQGRDLLFVYECEEIAEELEAIEQYLSEDDND